VISTGNSWSSHVTPEYCFTVFNISQRPLQRTVKLLIHFQCAWCRMLLSATKHVRTDVFVWRDSVHVYCRMTRTDRQSDRPVFCPCHNRTSILHFTVKRFQLSCPHFDRLNLGGRPTTSLHCNSENTPRHVSTKRYSKYRLNVSCPPAVLPSGERSPNPLNPLHYVSWLNEEWIRPNCMKLYVRDVTHWRKPLIVLSTGYCTYCTYCT
jgi:hypothetical protein